MARAAWHEQAALRALPGSTGTQVENLCYWGHRLKSWATGGHTGWKPVLRGDTQVENLCYEGQAA